jgi:hypothetical protein
MNLLEARDDRFPVHQHLDIRFSLSIESIVNLVHSRSNCKNACFILFPNVVIRKGIYDLELPRYATSRSKFTGSPLESGYYILFAKRVIKSGLFLNYTIKVII